MTPREHITWWMKQLEEQLRDFMENPQGGSQRGMADLMNQYQEAVAAGQVEPPRFSHLIRPSV